MIVAIECPKCRSDNPDDSIYCGKCTILLRGEPSVSHTKTLETPREELTTGFTFAGEYQINPRPHEAISEGQFSRKGRQ